MLRQCYRFGQQFVAWCGQALISRTSCLSFVMSHYHGVIVTYKLRSTVHFLRSVTSDGDRYRYTPKGLSTPGNKLLLLETASIRNTMEKRQLQRSLLYWPLVSVPMLINTSFIRFSKIFLKKLSIPLFAPETHNRNNRNIAGTFMRVLTLLTYFSI